MRGIQKSEVKPNRIRKSVATEYTFTKNLTSEIFMLEKLEKIATELERRLKEPKVTGKTITLKIKYSDFKLQTRSKTIATYTNNQKVLFETVKALLFQDKIENSVRLLGISLSNLDTQQKETVENPIDVQLKFEF